MSLNLRQFSTQFLPTFIGRPSAFPRAAIFALLFGGILMFSASAKPVRDKHVEAELITGVTAIVPGEKFVVGLRLVADEGWHTYWINPASPGYITTLDLELPPGFSAGPLQYPYPHRFTTKNYTGGEDHTGYGYEGEAILIVEITAPEELAPGMDVSISGLAKWLMCDPSSCVPGKAELALTLPVAAAGTSQAPASKDAEVMRGALGELPVVPGWKMQAEFVDDAVELKVPVGEGFELPAEVGEGLHVYALRHDGMTMISDQSEAVIKPGGKQSFSLEGGTLKIRAAKSPYAPPAMPDPFEVVIASDQGFGGAQFGNAIHVSTGEIAASSARPGSGASTAVEGNEAAGEGWGYWLQRPMIVMILTALMLGLALSLFGVFEVGVGLTSAGGKLANSSGLAGSFFSGALATVLATPCTAPFMGPAIAYALGQPGVVTMAVFTALGFGMVLPYLLLSIFPGAVQKLPRPGPWMETFKQVMGFPMLAVVGWLLWVLTFQIDSNGLLLVFAALIAISLAAWWYGRFATPNAGRKTGTRWVARLATVTFLVLAFSLFARASERRQPAVERDVEAQIAELQEKGQGVFVDFTAAWCVSCQANKAFIHDEDVERAMQEHNIAFLEVDWTQQDNATLKVMEKYGGSGVPLYLLFSSDADEAPVKLKEVFTSDRDIIDAIEDREGAVAEAAAKKKLTLLPALIGAVIGGLILNLMPCVFPVISLKIMGFVAQGGEDKRKIFQHGMAFAAGAMLFFWILAGSLILLRSSIAA